MPGGKQNVVLNACAGRASLRWDWSEDPRSWRSLPDTTPLDREEWQVQHLCLMHSLGNPKLWKWQLLANLPTFASQWDLVFIILVRNQMCLLPSSETDLFVPRLFVAQTSLKRSWRTESANTPAQKTYRNARDSWRIVCQWFFTTPTLDDTWVTQIMLSASVLTHWGEGLGQELVLSYHLTLSQAVLRLRNSLGYSRALPSRILLQ